MTDDSFKYLGHNNLQELVAELRNKMGVVIAYSDVLKLKNNTDDEKIKSKLEQISEEFQEKIIEVAPLLKRYLREFEEYNLD